jgi:hypothetical protein
MGSGLNESLELRRMVTADEEGFTSGARNGITKQSTRQAIIGREL